MTVALEWEPPGDGVWWSTREHFPQPVSRLFSVLFPPVTVGWERAAARYGTPMGTAQWGAVNGWMYFQPGELDPESVDARARAAAVTLAEEPWRDEVRRWREEERPAAVAANLALQAAPPDIERAIANLHRWAPLHFEHASFDFAGGLLLEAAAGWGIEPAAVVALLAGASPATSEVERHLAAIRSAGDDDTSSPASATDAYLLEYGWRLIAGHDLAEPTIGERPELLAAALRVPRDHQPRRPDREAVRNQAPPAERERFDALLAAARASYALRDDDVGVCFNWPLGLVRRAVLEAARAFVTDGRLAAPEHLFEAEPDELGAPDGEELAARLRLRQAAAAVEPPFHLGRPRTDTPPPPSLPPEMRRVEAIVQAGWSVTPARQELPLHGVGVGSAAARGPARVIIDPDDVSRIEPGDVLISITTTTAFNAVFPLIAGVATAEGGLLSHTAILARELGVPAVVGIPGLLDQVHDGDVVEVDPAAGLVRIVHGR